MIRRGEEWGSPAGGARPDLEVGGDDAALASALARTPAETGSLMVRFSPSAGSDLARALGLGRGGQRAGLAVPLDLWRVGDGRVAVNGVVLGVPPDRLRWWHPTRRFDWEIDGVGAGARATTVVVMTGQFLRGFDVSPRGHPGDGVGEIQIYGLRRAERAEMRSRLRSGSHLPHPAITSRRGRVVRVRCERSVPLEIDGRAAGRVQELTAELCAGAYRLLV